MEMADLIVVTKADGDLLPAARRAQLEYTSALKFMQPKTPFWQTKVGVEPAPRGQRHASSTRAADASTSAIPAVRFPARS